jgi:DNA-binding ferritin-like protein
LEKQVFRAQRLIQEDVAQALVDNAAERKRLLDERAKVYMAVVDAEARIAETNTRDKAILDEGTRTLKDIDKQLRELDRKGTLIINNQAAQMPIPFDPSAALAEDDQ